MSLFYSRAVVRAVRSRPSLLATQPSVPLDPQYHFFCKFGSSFQPSLPAVAGQRASNNQLAFTVQQLEVWSLPASNGHELCGHPFQGRP